MPAKPIGKNNYRGELKEVSDDIYPSLTEGYFFVFEMDEKYEVIENSLSLFNKSVLIEVFSSEYLVRPQIPLAIDEALYFKEIAVVYAKLTLEQIKKINEAVRDFKIDTERLFQLFPPLNKVFSFKEISAYSSFPDWVEVKNNLSDVFVKPDNWGFRMIGMLDMDHTMELTGKGVKIALLDTGFDVENDFFDPRRIKGEQFFVEDSIMDYHGHGTHCTGIACGFKDNSEARYGIAEESEVYIAKVLNANGDGMQINMLKGIFWALKNGCQVISISSEEPFEEEIGYSLVYERAIKYAIKNKCMVVASAGNCFYDCEEGNLPISGPANCPSALAIGSINKNCEVSYFSNKAFEEYKQKVDFVAPGEDIYSIWAQRGTPEKKVKIHSGTSMAAPYVSGIIALLWQRHPEFNCKEILSALKQIPPINKNGWRKEEVGMGLVQIK